MGDTFNFNGSIGQFIAKGDGHIEHYHAQSMASSSTSSPGEEQADKEATPHDGKGEVKGAIPTELTTPKAQGVLQGLRRIGLLDEAFQPLGMSWAERGYLAQQIAFKLDIEHQWVAFSRLWHCEAAALRSGYNRAKDMPKMAAFDERIKDIIG